MTEAVILEKVIIRVGKTFSPEGRKKARVHHPQVLEPTPGEGWKPLHGTRLSAEPELLVPDLPVRTETQQQKPQRRKKPAPLMSQQHVACPSPHRRSGVCQT